MLCGILITFLSCNVTVKITNKCRQHFQNKIQKQFLSMFSFFYYFIINKERQLYSNIL